MVLQDERCDKSPGAVGRDLPLETVSHIFYNSVTNILQSRTTVIGDNMHSIKLQDQKIVDLWCISHHLGYLFSNYRSLYFDR